MLPSTPPGVRDVFDASPEAVRTAANAILRRAELPPLDALELLPRDSANPTYVGVSASRRYVVKLAQRHPDTLAQRVDRAAAARGRRELRALQLAGPGAQERDPDARRADLAGRDRGPGAAVALLRCSCSAPTCAARRTIAAMTWRRWLALAALLSLATACTAPRLYYGGPARASHVREAQREALLRIVEPALAAAGILRIEVADGSERIVRERAPGAALPLDGIPVVALQAARIVLDDGYRGAELDVLVDGSGAGDPARIWSVSRDLGGGLWIERGAARTPLGGADLSPDELARRFSIGPLEDSAEVRWSPDERRTLAQSLELLAPAELELLAALPFGRQRVGPDPRHAGLYVRSDKNRGGEVLLFDLAFDDADSYVGGRSAAHPYAVYVILHEVGHAIAKLYRERVLLQYRKDVETFNGLVAKVNGTVDEYNRGQQVLSADRPMKASERRELERRQQTLSGEISRVKGLLGRAKRQLRKMEKIAAGPTPMEQLYAQLPDALSGPTPYGRTDVSESFAESFALFHVDPDSLKRVSPVVHAWFASGQHLSLSTGPESAAAAAAPAATER